MIGHGEIGEPDVPNRDGELGAIGEPYARGEVLVEGRGPMCGGIELGRDGQGAGGLGERGGVGIEGGRGGGVGGGGAEGDRGRGRAATFLI